MMAGRPARPPSEIATIVFLAGAVGALASIGPLAHAAARKRAPKKSADPCDYPATEQALLSCRRRECDRAEADIAKLVAALTKSYATDGALAAAFSTVQTKWREFRDAECKLQTYYSQGETAYESYWLECLAKLDHDRLESLEDLKDHP
jgi:uncharacterized protein YecT (DUF1311 family)